MTRNPWWIVAAYAAFSAVLIIVVYTTLLQNGGDGPLTDVEGPGTVEGNRELPSPPRPPGPVDRRPAVPPATGPGPPATGPGPSLASNGTGLASPPGTAPGGRTRPPDREARDPTGNQYGTTVAQIRARLGAAPD